MWFKIKKSPPKIKKKSDLDQNQNHRQVDLNRDLNHFRFKSPLIFRTLVIRASIFFTNRSIKSEVVSSKDNNVDLSVVSYWLNLICWLSDVKFVRKSKSGFDPGHFWHFFNMYAWFEVSQTILSINKYLSSLLTQTESIMSFTFWCFSHTHIMRSTNADVDNVNWP
jgi:hypothetical protein